jgi:hypothetical protein
MTKKEYEAFKKVLDDKTKSDSEKLEKIQSLLCYFKLLIK